MELDETQVEVPKKHATLILMNVCVGQFIVGLDQRALLVALLSPHRRSFYFAVCKPWVAP